QSFWRSFGMLPPGQTNVPLILNLEVKGEEIRLWDDFTVGGILFYWVPADGQLRDYGVPLGRLGPFFEPGISNVTVAPMGPLEIPFTRQTIVTNPQTGSIFTFTNTLQVILQVQDELRAIMKVD